MVVGIPIVFFEECCTTGVLKDESEFHLLTILDDFPANLRIYVVEPRGFEPLTSAVQRQVLRFANVHCGS
jgi:hypothetical protein